MILYAKDVRESSVKQIKEEVATFTRVPKLVIITVGEDSASKIYVNSKIKLAREVGIDAQNIIFDENVIEDDLLKYIESLNNDNRVNGVIVQLPLPDKFNESRIIQSVATEKDVDAFSTEHVYNIINGSNEILPATVSGVIDLLNFYNIKIASKNIVICGRSMIVGKPLFHALTNLNATVSLCHSHTNNIKSYIDNCDIFISAIGHSKFFTEDYFTSNPNITVIDVGINRDENNKISGDVDFTNVSKVVKNISPVPKGVGVLTVVNVVKNTVINYKKMNEGDY